MNRRQIRHRRRGLIPRGRAHSRREARSAHVGMVTGTNMVGGEREMVMKGATRRRGRRVPTHTKRSRNRSPRTRRGVQRRKLTGEDSSLGYMVRRRNSKQGHGTVHMERAFSYIDLNSDLNILYFYKEGIIICSRGKHISVLNIIKTFRMAHSRYSASRPLC